MAERTSLKQIRDVGKRKKAGTDIGVIGALADPQFLEEVLRGLGETSARGVAGVLGAPVDLTTMALRPFGYSVPAEQVVGGSDYIGRQMERAGLISGERRPIAEMLGGIMTPDPLDVAKLGAMAVPVVARRMSPRDEALRIAQANAAKPTSEGGLGLRPDNTPMERAQAMGFYDGWKHGSPNPNITEFDPNIPVKRGTDFGPATFATKSSDNASGYSLNWDSYETAKSANKKVQADIEERNRTIASIPAAFESGDFDKVDRLKSKLDDLWQSENDMYENFLNYKIPSEGSTVYPLMIRSENMPWVEGGRKHYMKVHPEAINEARVSGAPGVRINDVADNAGRFGGLSDVIAVFDPSRIRSRFAAFDPARRYESDLLGAADPRLLGIVGAGTAAGLYGYDQRQKEKEKRSAK